MDYVLLAVITIYLPYFFVWGGWVEEQDEKEIDHVD